jgi:hypothetical protein
MPANVRVAAYIFSAIFTIVLAEVGSFVCVKLLQQVGRARFLFYTPPPITATEYADYLEHRDSRLGWPAPHDIPGDLYDATGSRPSAAFPAPGDECISLYGDSFTYSPDIDHADAWSNVLSEEVDCRIANYGVWGYGTDQAYLRFKFNESDLAPVTILGFYPWDVLRNVSQYLYLNSLNNQFSFKPRFAMQHGNLIPVPISTLDADQLKAFSASPETFLKHETFLPDTRFGPTRAKFPYSLTLLKAAMNQRVFYIVSRRPSWMGFLEPEHGSQGLELTARIFETFVDLCQQRNKRCSILLFPTPSSYKYYRRTGKLALQGLIDATKRANIDCLDLTVGLAHYLGERSYCELLIDPERCDGHHNPEGDRVVATLVYDFLIQTGLIAHLQVE